jgi:hypothetical protein
VTEDSLSGGEREQAQGDALVPLGYIFAVIVPFVGLVLGIIAATRPAGRSRRNGPWIIALATVAFAVWGSVIYTQVHNSEEHAAQAQQAGREEVVSRLQTENNEAENTQQEEAEREYCSEHPHAGEHMAGGYHYYECTPVYEAGG